MSFQINAVPVDQAEKWDAYVKNHPDATLYHQYTWKKIIEQTYGNMTCYLWAMDGEKVCGVLPLVHLKHFLFGNTLLSMPYFDMGGILADSEDIENALAKKAAETGKALKAQTVELRHTRQLAFSTLDKQLIPSCAVQSHKVRMLLELPESSEVLMKSFKSKLRSQIKKPIKEGLEYVVGKGELLDEFYEVFLTNMRDLGSPVHAKALMENVLNNFRADARIIVVRKDNVPYAASMVCGFKETLENPWASSLREYSRLSPNMLLYWAMLEYACDNGFKYFDFGRSTPDEGTFRFKKQWGAKPQPLFWQHLHLKPQPDDSSATDPDVSSKFDKAVALWQKLPVGVTRIIGPMIRKHIGL